MRLNPDCVRDILLDMEENTDFGTFIHYDPKEDHEAFRRISKYPPDEVLYHIRQCEYSGLLIVQTWTMAPSVVIKDLSPAGHEFLANVRADTNWNKVKEKAKIVGSESLSVLAQIAGQVIAGLLSKT